MRGRFGERFKKGIVAAFFMFWIVYFFMFWAKGLYYDAFDNLVAGHVNIWGDWAAHMTMGTAMAVRGPLLSESPLIVGQPFAYPFVSNMLSGFLFNLGFSLIDSFLFPSFFFSLAVVFALFWLYKTLFQSRKIALLATTIFLLNGGIGFYYFVQDIASSPKPLTTFLNPPHEYTRYDQKGIKWISVIDSMIIPQRAFGLGFPVGLLALGLIYQASFKKHSKQTNKKLVNTKMVQAGLLLGLLPIIHTHSFLALFVILGCWSSGDILLIWLKEQKSKKLKELLFKKILHWASLAAITAVLAIPLISLFLLQNVENFITWYPGWLAIDFKENWFVFWFKNWTIVPLLAGAGWLLLLQSKKRVIRNFGILFLPFFILFTVANLWLFQPYAWDNTKLLIWSSVGFSGLSAWLLNKGWIHATSLIPHKKIILKSLLVICFCFVTASGVIDTYYISRHDLHSHVMFSKEEVDLASWARKNTPPDSRWLTGEQHNHWLFVLTGRQTLMAYRGWLWTHGYDYKPVEAAVSKMFMHPEGNANLFKQYDVDYIVIGPNEKMVWQANTQYFADHAEQFTLIKLTENYSIYQAAEAI